MKHYENQEYIIIPLLQRGHLALTKKNISSDVAPKYIDMQATLEKHKECLIEALTMRILKCEETLLKALDKDTIISIDSYAIRFNKSDKTWAFNLDSHILMLNLLEKIKHDISYLCRCTGKEAYQMMKALHYHHEHYPEEILSLLLMRIEKGR